MTKKLFRPLGLYHRRVPATATVEIISCPQMHCTLHSLTLLSLDNFMLGNLRINSHSLLLGIEPIPAETFFKGNDVRFETNLKPDDRIRIVLTNQSAYPQTVKGWALCYLNTKRKVK